MATKKTKKSATKKSATKTTATKTTATTLARVRVEVDGRVVALDDVHVGYNYERKGLLLDFVVPLDARRVDVRHTRLAFDDGAVVLVPDAVRIADATDTAAALAALRDKEGVIVDAIRETVGKKKLTWFERPPHAALSASLDDVTLGWLRHVLVDDDVHVLGDGVDRAHLQKSKKLKVKGASFFVGDLATIAARRLDNAVNNHDNDPDDLAVALGAWIDVGGTIAVADAAAVVLLPGPVPTTKQLAKLAKAWSKVNHDDIDEVIATLQEAAQRHHPALVWWS